MRRLLCLALTLFSLAVLLLPAALSAAPVASARGTAHSAKKKRKPKCHAKGKAHSKHAKSCKKKRHTSAGKTTKPSTGKTTTPSSGSGPPKPTLTASAVSLTPEERALFESVNKERGEHGVAALSTSAQLQPISEARAKQTAQEYATKESTSVDDIRVAIEDAGYCVTSQREIESGGPSRAEKELEESRKLGEPGSDIAPRATGRLALPGVATPAFAASLDSDETIEEQEIEEEERIPLESQWTLLGVAVAEAGAVAVELEDFVEPC
ncbi:MAG TPA: hypothetical protein VMF09_00715 [Solirubrobacteraceae bacterium]|nr:hypothetical protein [Solirubrobacteraceae bacterium]